MYFDPMYLVFALPAILLVMYAQWRVQSTYAKYTQVPNARRVTGTQAAEVLLQATGLQNVDITGVPGQLTDHYDPGKKILGLSAGVANTPSVAALGIVAHEVGHAQQDKEGYGLTRLHLVLPILGMCCWQVGRANLPLSAFSAWRAAPNRPLGQTARASSQVTPWTMTPATSSGHLPGCW